MILNMKKFLLVLGMITCLIGLSACGKAEEPFQGVLTQEQAVATVENFMLSMSEVVATGQQEAYASDAVLAGALASYEAAIADMGDYQSMNSCTFVEDEDGIVINAVIQGSKRPGTVEIIFDEEQLFSSATINATYTFGETMTKAALNTLMGMGTVFAVLILIAVLIYCFTFIPKIQAAFSKKDKKVESAADNAVAQIVENEAVQEEDDLELIAVIAAAIAASEGATSTDGYVVRSIRRIR
jgi:sodium pump decarboxylase gamma subunit